MDRAAELAKHEIGWWMAHHRGDKEDLVKQMSQLYVLLFKVSSKDARKIVLHRVKAAKFHDKAEEHEDKRDQIKADRYWLRAETELRVHFALLEKKRRR